MAKFWTMRDGTKIRPEKMETSHIENSMRMLKRKVERLKDAHAGKLLFSASGEMASEAAEEAAISIYEMTDVGFLREYTMYGDFEKELETRGRL